MKLSLVIPAYNCENYLQKCVDSILGQTFQDFEVILIDDGSSDKTPLLCDQYATQDEKVKVIHKKNGGVSSARNQGISIASGERIMFIDADDYLVTETYLAEMLENIDCDYVADGYLENRILDNQKSKFRRATLGNCSGEAITDFPEDFFRRGFFHACWGKVYCLPLIKENEIQFGGHRVSEDSIFNLEYIKHISSWRIVDIVGYCYVRRNTGKNAIARFEAADIDSYIALEHMMSDMGLKKHVIRSTMYAQYLAVMLRIVNSEKESVSEKKERIASVFNKKEPRHTLLFHIGNFREWLMGIWLMLKWYRPWY